MLASWDAANECRRPGRVRGPAMSGARAPCSASWQVPLWEVGAWAHIARQACWSHVADTKHLGYTWVADACSCAGCHMEWARRDSRICVVGVMVGASRWGGARGTIRQHGAKDRAPARVRPVVVWLRSRSALPREGALTRTRCRWVSFLRLVPLPAVLASLVLFANSTTNIVG